MVKKWNIFAGRKHNFLPDDYGKECYDNLKKSEKETADSFEGKEQYNDTHKNYAFYSGCASVAMLGINDSTTAQPEQVQSETAAAEATAESAAEAVPEVCQFAVGAKYAYKKTYVTITQRNENMIEISVEGKTIVKNTEISDNVEIIKNNRGVALCRADKPYTDDTPTDPTDSPEQSTPETILAQAENATAAATRAETAEETATEAEAELLELPETKSIKFFYNGMKINGDKKITVKCSYDMDADGQTVRIYADGYGAQIPRDVFDNVKNDSDIMTDYFDKDGCTVTPAHPLFKYIQYAAAKCELSGYKANRKETYEKFIAVNPGQPTATDMSAVAKYNADRAAAAKAAAEERSRWYDDFEPIDGMPDPESITDTNDIQDTQDIQHTVNTILQQLDNMPDGDFKCGAKWAIMQLLGIDSSGKQPTITRTDGGAKITMSINGVAQ